MAGSRRSVGRASVTVLVALGAAVAALTAVHFGCQVPAAEQLAAQGLGIEPTPTTAPAPTSIDGLIAWFDAAEVVKEGNAVKEWPDRSSNKNDVAMTDAARRPVQLPGEVAGLPVVHFDAKKKQTLLSEKLKTPTSNALTAVFVVQAPKTAEDGTFATVGTYGHNAGNPDYLRTGPQGISGRIYAANIRTGNVVAPLPLTGADVKIAMVEWDLVGGRTRVFQNGQILKAGKGPTKLDLQQNLSIGSYCGLVNFFDGGIAEILFYNRVLTDAQRRDLHAYLANKYKLDFTRRITPLATTLPYAYYPSRNQVEAAVDVRAFGAKPDPTDKSAVAVAVVPVGAETPVATGKIKLNAQGLGQDTFNVPDLKDGKYNVRFTYNGVTKVSPKVFERIHFPWETCDLGSEHKVYAPFEPVTVKGPQVRVVSRAYHVNGFGLFDSIQSEGQELLAEPIRLEGLAGGKKIQWRLDKPTVASQHEDLAMVQGQADGGPVRVRTVTRIEEDGCARVEMELTSGVKPAAIDKLWVEIPLKDEQVPLFHYAVGCELRNNYGGVLPRGKVTWDTGSQIGTPMACRVEPGPSEGLVWDSTQFRVWPSQVDLVAPVSTFMPYIWLGGETRGLAWFGDNYRGYEVDMASPIQTIHREGKKVVLRVHLVQAPLTLTQPRKIVFGLMASPTKPLPADWRSRDIPGGWECVTPWGGYYCSSKYPDGYDFQLVDKIMEASRTGKIDTPYFEQKDKNRVRKNDKVQGHEPWVETQKRFAAIAASSMGCIGRPGALVTYFEEHATEPTYPEFQVFQDEWSELEFPRFQPYVTAGGGNFTGSYRNFVAYYGEQYIRRGAGLYFDNCYPQMVFNPASTQAFALADGALRPTVNLWDSRAYYKRIYKIIQFWNEKKVHPAPLNFYLHVTNTQVLPYTTWSTFLLDQEQTYRRDEKNQLLPWPADYLRAVTIARTAGSIPTALNPLRNGLRDSEPWPKATPELRLTNWGMHAVHEVRGMGLYVGGPLSYRYDQAWMDFGYRAPDVKVYNYWDAAAPMKVDGDQVKWVAQVRNGRGAIVLQSYTPEPVEAVVRWPGAVAMMEYQDRKLLSVAKDGTCRVKLPGNHGTAMLTVWTDAATVPPARDAKTLFLDDFELGVRLDTTTLPQTFSIVPDSAAKGNYILRMAPGKSSQHVGPNEGKAPAVTGPFETSFRFRVPALPKDRRGNGLTALVYGTDDKKLSFQFTLDMDTVNGQTTWAFTPPQMFLNGQGAPLTSGQTDLTVTGDVANGPIRKELGAVDTKWHRVAVRVDGKTHTVMLDDKVVFQGTCTESVSTAGFRIGSSWDQTAGGGRVPYVEIDDIRVQSLDRK